MKIIHILYKTVRTETGEYYIGVHGIDTDRYPKFNDPYLGSGDRIKASVKKHGAKAFHRSILSISESRDVVEALEAAIVTVEMIADPLCLNLAPGGRAGVKGSPSPLKGVPKGPRSVEHCQAMSDARKGVSTGPFSAERCQAISDAQRGKTHSVETRQAMSDARKGVPSPQKGIPKSPEHRQAISDAMKGKTSPTKGVPRVPHSVETRQAISDAQKERWSQRKLANAST